MQISNRIGKVLEKAGRKFLGGHACFRVGQVQATVYGFNAMHVSVNVTWPSLEGLLCIHPSVQWLGEMAPWSLRAWPWYVYLSPDGTPDSAVWGIGPGWTGSHLRDKSARARFVENLRGAA